MSNSKSVKQEQFQDVFELIAKRSSVNKRKEYGIRHCDFLEWKAMKVRPTINSLVKLAEATGIPFFTLKNRIYTLWDFKRKKEIKAIVTQSRKALDRKLASILGSEIDHFHFNIRAFTLLSSHYMTTELKRRGLSVSEIAEVIGTTRYTARTYLSLNPVLLFKSLKDL